MKTAIEHIKENGLSSRTNKFNAVWTSLTALVTAYLATADLSNDVTAMIPAIMVFISSVVNTLLYGATHVKHSSERS